MSNRPDAFHQALNIPMSAKRLVLSLFAAFDDGKLPIARLITAGSIFDIEDAAIRMAIKRLVNDGVLSVEDRGWYGIGERGKTLYEATRAWQILNDRVKEWAGDWFCIHVAHLGRSNRQAVRAHQRAFTLYGFAELEQGLWIRPDNLILSTHELATELIKVGLDKRAIIMRVNELVDQQIERVEQLWDRKALEGSYRSGLAAMKESAAKVGDKPQTASAREVLEIGSSVISVLTHDPLLPESFVDTDLRNQLYTAMLSYNTLGKDIWIALFDGLETG